jgi:hypothetical protein
MTENTNTTALHYIEHDADGFGGSIIVCPVDNNEYSLRFMGDFAHCAGCDRALPDSETEIEGSYMKTYKGSSFDYSAGDDTRSFFGSYL